MPPDPLTVFSQGSVRLIRERPFIFENPEVLIEFRSRLWRGERHGDRRLLEDEPVPVRGSGDRERGWVVRRRTQESPPPESGVGDDRQPERLCDREYVPLGTAVGGVVSDHDGIEEPALRHPRRKRALVTRDTDPADSSVAFRVPKVLNRAAGRGELLPFSRPLDVVEGEHVDVVSPEGCEDRTQFRRGVGFVPRAELSTNCDQLAPGAERGNGRGEGVTIGCPFGQALPVEEVDAPIDCREDVVSGDRGPAVRRETKAADGEAEAR